MTRTYGEVQHTIYLDDKDVCSVCGAVRATNGVSSWCIPCDHPPWDDVAHPDEDNWLDDGGA